MEQAPLTMAFLPLKVTFPYLTYFYHFPFPFICPLALSSYLVGTSVFLLLFLEILHHYSFTRHGITKFHKLDDLKQQKLTLSQG
jgi:hypothetical protein